MSLLLSFSPSPSTNPQSPSQAGVEADLDIEYTIGIFGSTESSFASSLATRVCNGYMALGTRGVSVVFASGYGGVCENHDSTGNLHPSIDTISGAFDVRVDPDYLMKFIQDFILRATGA
ncbi:hypothetical protein DFH08DRAFT_964728 [Mycena albidolilacea]|uniref:Uncharacterized protein n=1 Tax=Mycena albidolilacea TaxID=1033008 RepID=A0AAD6ZSB7_9AGAR|nr:hypothetical protein DFH08DRAFT_964728 [Mycena albidolilacea]